MQGHGTLKGTLDDHHLRKELALPENAPVIGYLGSLGTWYLVEDMLRCFANWRQKRPLVFLILTGENPESVYEMTHKCGVSRDDLRVLSARREDVPAYVQLMDVGLFFIQPCYAKQASSPTKLAEFLAAGKPVVTLGGVGDLDTQLSEQPFAQVLSDTTESEYNRAYQALDALFAVDPALPRAFAYAEYRLEWGIERYAAVYRGLLGESGQAAPEIEEELGLPDSPEDSANDNTDGSPLCQQSE